MLNVDFSMLVTVLYVIILYVFLSRLFFRPIMEILHTRRQLIEGRLEESQRRMEIVEQRTSEYEQAIRTARSEAYRQQELERERSLSEKGELVRKAKAEAEVAVREGREQLAAQADAARAGLTAEVDNLAKQLAEAVLRD
jgi:F-type H+-transporting ATPase subunit b